MLMRLMSMAKTGSLLCLIETIRAYDDEQTFDENKSKIVQKHNVIVLLSQIKSKSSYVRVQCLTQFGILWLNSEYLMVLMT